MSLGFALAKAPVGVIGNGLPLVRLGPL